MIIIIVITFLKPTGLINNKLRYQYRKDYNVMFIIENPFLLTNQKLKSLLNKRNSTKMIKINLTKSVTIIKEKGIKFFCKKNILEKKNKK